jgi:uncharacterized protein (TIGR02452 family)
MAVTWNKEAFYQKASKGSFAARAARADVYKNNCEIFQAGGYKTESGKEVSLDPSTMLGGTVVYDSPVALVESAPLAGPTVTGVANMGSLEMGRELQLKGFNPVILNLADAYIACGWYFKGSKAQEESLCRQSTLSQSLFQYYRKESAEISGVPFKEEKYPMDIRFGAIYSPHVNVFRKSPRDGFALMEEPYETSFISCAALDFNERHGKNLEYRSDDGGFTSEGKAIMLSKIRTIFSAALAGGHDAVVLGAWGCGAFRLRPDRVAGLFRDVLFEPEFKDRFKTVVFAILENDGPESEARGKFAPFYHIFGRYGSSGATMKAPELQVAPVDISKYGVGSVVEHDKFGKGTITEIQEDKGRVVVNFIVYGPKTLAIEKAKLTFVG